jgi:hypothetical protein
MYVSQMQEKTEFWKVTILKIKIKTQVKDLKVKCSVRVEQTVAQVWFLNNKHFYVKNI